MNFNEFADAINKQFKKMSKTDLFVVDIPNDDLWETYMEAFPAGTNEVYRERRAYDCNICKQFIKRASNVVAIVGGELVTVWDVKAEGYYAEVAAKMAATVKAAGIRGIFLHNEPTVGKVATFEEIDGGVKTWNHFYCDIPANFVEKDMATIRGKANSSQGVFKRALEEFTDMQIIQDVIDLIEEDGIYRGAEHLKVLKEFGKLQLHSVVHRNKPRGLELYAWNNYRQPGAHIRSSVIGSLLIDLFKGKPMDEAVKSFEAKVAPANYKRTKSLVTKGMITQALKKVDELGIEESLHRRYATSEDLSINNVLFADRSTKMADKGSLESLLMATVKDSSEKLDNVPEISIADFMKDVLPNSTSIEALLKNSHVSNLASIIAPVNADAPNILQWDNNFSWSYHGGVTDSLREKVQAAGGRIDGAFRFTHSWNDLEPNQSLMDLHVFMPGNDHYPDNTPHDKYGSGRRVGWNKRQDGKSGGIQDVDYTNAAPSGYVPVENITFPSVDKMPEGDYVCKIHNWSFRGTGGRGRAEIEFDGQVHQYEYPATTRKQWITVATVTLKNGEFTIKHHLPSSTSTKEVWNINTEKFHKVDMMLLSPNHWDGNETGNKHYFFMLNNCNNPEDARGLYTEFLSNNLREHRKVFEMLGSKLKCPHAANQLSGLGFSSTQRNELIVRVKGATNRTLKIKF